MDLTRIGWAAAALLFTLVVGFSEAAPPTGIAKKEANEIDMAAMTIVGVCTDENGKPLADISVVLYQRVQIALNRSDHFPESRFVTVQTTMTDVRGHFQIADATIPPVQENTRAGYLVVLTASGRASQSIEIQLHDKVPAYEVTMPPAATLSGRITNPDGRPIPGVRVWTLAGETPDGVWSSVSDADGRYAIGDLRAFDLRTAKPMKGDGGSTMRLSGVTLTASHPDYVQKHTLFAQVPGTVDFVLDDGGTVEGQVIDAVTQKPAANAVVMARSTNRTKGDNWRWTRADQQGRYQFKNLGEAAYVIWACAEDRTCVALTSVPVIRKQTYHSSDLKLIEGAWIEGRIVGAEDQPLTHDPETGDRLLIGIHGPSYPKNAPGSDCREVDDEGRFHIRVAPGRNDVQILSNGGNIWERTVDRIEFEKGIDVAAGETTQLLFRVRTERLKGKPDAKAANRQLRIPK